MELRNDTLYKLNLDVVEKMLEYVLDREGYPKDVSVAFVDETVISQINEAYRKGNGPTDVLTFVYDDDEIYGEVIICPEYVKKEAERNGKSFNEQMVITLVHAALHLCGYDHEFSTERADEMFKKQEEYVREILSGGFDSVVL